MNPPLSHSLNRRTLFARGGMAGVIGGATGVLFATDVPARAEGNVDWIINVQDYGAVGDGISDDSAAIQTAIDDAAVDSRPVYLPAGTYLIGTALEMRDGLTMQGADPFTSILRLAPSCNGPILNTETKNEPDDDLALDRLTFDGDFEHTEIPAEANPAALLHTYNCRRWHITNCRFIRGRGYGVGLEGVPSATYPLGPQQDVYFANCEFSSNQGKGDGIDTKSMRRLTMVNCIAQEQTVGFDIRAHFATIVNCHARNCPYGIQLRTSAGTVENYGYLTVLGGSAENCAGAGLQVAISLDQTTDPLGYTRATIVGFDSRRNTHGLVSSVPDPITEDPDSAIALSVIGGHFEENTGYGLGMPLCRSLTMRGVICRKNGSDGLRLRRTMAATISGCKFSDNAGWGVNLSEDTDGVSLTGNQIHGNTAGTVTGNGSASVILRNICDQGITLASAATLTIPDALESVVLSGSATVSSIAPSRNGRRVTLYVPDSVTLVSGNNLHLKEPFDPAAGGTLFLVAQEGKWFELSRSVY